MLKKLFIGILIAAFFVVCAGYFLVYYYVEFGDTLVGIAEAFDVSPSTILDWNPTINPLHLKPGQEIVIPIPNGIICEVQKGDTLDAISKRFFTVVELIKEANSLNTDIIFPGQKLFIPTEIIGLAFNDTKTLIWPVYGRITSTFGWRIHPITKKWSFHTGVDVAAPFGSPVFAAESGIVEFAGKKSGYGMLIVINHGYFKTAYGHLSKINVFVGQYVRRGEFIGRVGNTGISTGPHLHFEVRINDKFKNPLTFLPSPNNKYVLGASQRWMGGR